MELSCAFFHERGHTPSFSLPVLCCSRAQSVYPKVVFLQLHSLGCLRWNSEVEQCCWNSRNVMVQQISSVPPSLSTVPPLLYQCSISTVPLFHHTIPSSLFHCSTPLIPHNCSTVPSHCSTITAPLFHHTVPPSMFHCSTTLFHHDCSTVPPHCSTMTIRLFHHTVPP